MIGQHCPLLPFQVRHGLCEQGEGAPPAEGQDARDLPAAVQREPPGRDHLHVGGPRRERCVLAGLPALGLWALATGVSVFRSAWGVALKPGNQGVLAACRYLSPCNRDGLTHMHVHSNPARSSGEQQVSHKICSPPTASQLLLLGKWELKSCGWGSGEVTEGRYLQAPGEQITGHRGWRL